MDFSESQVSGYIKAIHEILACIDGKRFIEANILASSAISRLLKIKSGLRDEQKNNVFLFEQTFKLLQSNSQYWESIVEGDFSESWNKLQDCLDYVRRLKKFSSKESPLLSFYEKQLVALEGTYPYTLFSSIGMVVDKYICSLCGLDIDSLDCPHIVGELYAGEIAYGVVQGEGAYLDHVAITEHPKDKRCILNPYKNNAPQFSVQLKLSGYIKEDKMKPLGFQKISKIIYKRHNPDYKKLSRNAACFCGSNKKFKNCCINNQLVNAVHFEFISDEGSPNKRLKGTVNAWHFQSH
ncbi:hypothetical protein CIK04_15395 [Vibrio sp. 03_296]|uniref:YecA family protein n=1 Tax=Vibrio TaxID=662 RepID=UPI000BD7A60C|nr:MULTISPECIES: SEC-C metal-binding domain-containing protein [Vibrio]OZT83939.1 hypothetical protein CIK04_15395 [Vibrio sp. 03_296]PJO11036.1 hypothetical protein COO31_021130 [Vibrio vulnificus]